MTNLTVTTFQPAEQSPELIEQYQAEVTGGVSDPFGMNRFPDGELVWRPKDWCVALMDGDRMVASAGLLVVQVSVGMNDFEMVGFGSVITAPERRGTGLARALMAEAVVFAATLGPELGLLLCTEDLVGLYAKFGWHRIDEPLIVAQPEGPHPMIMPGMWTSLTPEIALPEGQLRVNSLPF